MTVTDTVKQIVDELELERRLNEATEVAEKAVHRVRELAGDYAHSHGSDIERMLDKAGTAFDARTDGKFADTVAKVQEQVRVGVARLAELRAEADVTDADVTDADRPDAD